MHANPYPFDPFDRAFLHNPYQQLEKMRALGPLVPTAQPNGIHSHAVLSHAVARTLLTDKRVSADPQHGKDALARAGIHIGGSSSGLSDASLLTTDPPTHTRLRRLLANSGEVDLFDGLGGLVADHATQLLDGHPCPERIDLVNEFAMPLTIRVLCSLLGISEEAARPLTGWIGALLTPKHVPGADALRSDADARLRDFLTTTLEAESGKSTTITSRLVRHWREDSGLLGYRELTNMLYELLLAGYLTTAGLIVNGTLALLNEPAARPRALERPGLLTENSVEELLRFDGPAFRGSLRFATEPIDIDGYSIDRGDLISVVFAATNRDPALYENPDRLDVDRGNADTHFGFSRGIHLCWGAPIARLETRIAVGELLSRGVELAVDPGDIEWAATGNSRSPRSLPVRLRCPRAGLTTSVERGPGPEAVQSDCHHR